MAFGVGRSAGMAGAEVGQDAWLGNPTNSGWSAIQPPLPSSVSDHFNEMSRGGIKTTLQWAGGAATGGVGNMVGETVMKPFVNAFFKKVHGPMHPDAAVPGPTCRWMNEQEPGAGDALRAEFKQKGFDVTANVGEKTNIRYGRSAFMLAAGTRAGVQAAQKLGFLGNLGTGTAGSTAAGLAIGAAMGTRSAHVTITVPTPEAVEAAKASGATLAEVMADPANTVEIPVAYTKHLPKPICAAVKGVTTRSSELEAGKWEAVKNAAKSVGDPLKAVAKSLKETPLRDPSGNPLQTVANVLGTWAQRSILMARSTAPGAMMRIVAIPCARLAEDAGHEKSGRLIRAAASAFDLYFVIKPWFTSLANTIVGGDAQVKQAREAYVAGKRARANDAADAPNLQGDADPLDQRDEFARDDLELATTLEASIVTSQNASQNDSHSTLPLPYIPSSELDDSSSSSGDADALELDETQFASTVNGYSNSSTLNGSHA
jgi:hypothetical protein